ncbi:poly-gamma-glutamate synthase PgsB [Thalassobacillus sp. CUG 92003]|uniref:poly-gamma-glutamate synthase PgsB n=1 Tax=Thalassobacillus sp. CUG 92003 TaxID=2736641 RepID=UPI0015E76AA5|nr:poly-gamma-glutamate synthase PgsB [Thalassobacillus sp. CUG 92003]
MYLIPAAVIFILVVGIYEWRQHQKTLNALPVRVNVNGIRGKSTVTRLITGILKEADYKVVGKTTGTSARLIYWDTPEERAILRRPEGPNIREQRIIAKEAADRGADSLVSECMAVNPDYQIVFQNKMLQANIGIIANVLEDHMEVMGPTIDEVAEALASTIPYRGHLILVDGPFVEYFSDIARKRRTKVIMADNDKIDEAYLQQFDYMVFPDNASLALAVAEALDIDESTALRGMLKAQPDPGAMRVQKLDIDHSSAYFVNGFAANDATSTINIWNRVEGLNYPTSEPIIIMNCREDRVERTEQFARDVLPFLPTHYLVLIGEHTQAIKEACSNGTIEVEHLLDYEGYTQASVVEALLPIMPDRVIYGVGNFHGAAESLIDELDHLKSTQSIS